MRLNFIITLLITALIVPGNSQEIRQLRIISEPELLEDNFVGSNYMDANGRICAGIMVVSDMEGFSYDSYNGVVDVNYRVGQDLVFVSPDERVLEIYHTGYEPLKVILVEHGVSLESRRIWKLKVAGDSIQQGNVVIITDPPGFSVLFDGLSPGKATPVEIEDQFASYHRIHIEGGPDYYDVDTSVVIDPDQTDTLRVTLKKSYAIAHIYTEPPAASIYINGNKIVKVTPASVRLQPGRSVIRLTKDNYVPYDLFPDLSSGEEKQFQVTLKHQTGTLIVNTIPTGAEIYVNENPVGKAPQVLRDYTIGTYRIKAWLKPDYVPQMRDAVVLYNDTTDVVINLKPGGLLIVDAKPSHARITVDGDSIRVGVPELLPGGRYQVIAKAPGYRTEKKKVSIKKGREKRIEFSLVKESEWKGFMAKSGITAGMAFMDYDNGRLKDIATERFASFGFFFSQYFDFFISFPVEKWHFDDELYADNLSWNYGSDSSYILQYGANINIPLFRSTHSMLYVGPGYKAHAFLLNWKSEDQNGRELVENIRFYTHNLIAGAGFRIFLTNAIGFHLRYEHGFLGDDFDFQCAKLELMINWNGKPK